MSASLPVIVLTQGDPAGVGPEIICKLLANRVDARPWLPLLVAERAAVGALEDRLVFLEGSVDRDALEALAGDQIAIVDPVSERRTIRPGGSTPADAAAAVAAIDVAVDLVQAGVGDALVTLPVSKQSIATHHLPDFRGHTEYLAEKAGLERYGRDYLMTFLAADLQVALLTTHIPLQQAIGELDGAQISEALDLMHRRTGGRIAVAGLNPHAGEGGLMGDEENRLIRPAVEQARQKGIEAIGPESADSLFARARRSEFDWVLALYHDQGLIAVKTAAFGTATNWTLGLPFLRTSVDHGTAFDIAGQNLADDGPLRHVVETTLRLISGQLPTSR